MSGSNAHTTIGFIGLGNMGGPMAKNLLAAGFPLVGADLDTAKVQSIVTLGGSAAEDALDAASQADIVFTSLPGPKQVEAVGCAIVKVMKPGSVWVDLSTNDLTCARVVEAAAIEAGIDILDAPVTGGAEGAEAGTLSVLIGGEQPVWERCRPAFQAIGDRIDLLGPRGAGYVAKIAQVSLCYLHSVCLTEAMLLGVKGGVAPDKMLDIIRHSTGASYVADLYGPEILNGGYDDTFDLDLAAKDLRLAMELATDVDATLPFMQQVTDFYAGTVERFGPKAPHLIAMQALERQNNLILHQHEPMTRERHD